MNPQGVAAGLTIPGYAMSRESVARAIDEARALADMRALPGWLDVLEMIQVPGRKALAKVEDMTPEDYIEAQFKVLAAQVPIDVLRQHLELGAIAQEKAAEVEQAAAAQEAMPVIVPQGMTQEAALKDAAKARRVSALLDHPGWPVFLGYWLGAVLAHSLMLQSPASRVENLGLHQEVVRFLPSVLKQVKTCVSGGACAAAWLRSQAEGK